MEYKKIKNLNMEAPKDKRTKAYKSWKANYDKQSKGLGDTIAKITKATGIDKAVKFLAGEDCGCSERQEALNKTFKYKRPKCLLENEYEYLTNWFSVPRNNVHPIQQKDLIKIYNRVFSKKQEITSCSSCIRNIVDDLNALYKTYAN
tara:strand:+ start:1053 stop:1493 length:441 start_codon:yes stop_codon:yes gene_type:complete